MAKYVHLVESPPPFPRKTKVFRVDSAVDGTLLGFVQWRSGWRRYVFHPQLGTVFDFECLEELAGKLRELTSLHKMSQAIAREKEAAESDLHQHNYDSPGDLRQMLP